jgi:hypothetical protein
VDVLGNVKVSLTNTSQDEEAGHEAPKVHRRIGRAVHEIIWVRTSRTNPIGERRNHIDSDIQEGPVLVPKGGGENDKEETDRKHLYTIS